MSEIRYLPTKTKYEDSPEWHTRLGLIAAAFDGLYVAANCNILVEQIEMKGEDAEDAGGGTGSTWRVTIAVGGTDLSETVNIEPVDDGRSPGSVAESLMNDLYQNSAYSFVSLQARAAGKPVPSWIGAGEPKAIEDDRPKPNWPGLPLDYGDPDYLGRPYRTPGQIATYKAVKGIA